MSGKRGTNNYLLRKLKNDSFLFTSSNKLKLKQKENFMKIRCPRIEVFLFPHEFDNVGEDMQSVTNFGLAFEAK